jgi:hypothetical protein
MATAFASVVLCAVLLAAAAEARSPHKQCKRRCSAARIACRTDRGAPARTTLRACRDAFFAARRSCARDRPCRRRLKRERRACEAPALQAYEEATAPCADGFAACRACCKMGGLPAECDPSHLCPGAIVGDPDKPPVVAFTAVEPGAATIRGTVANVDAGRLRISGWAQTDRWYAQPALDQPFTDVCADGSFSIASHPWRRFVGLVVDDTYVIPDAPSIDYHPSIGPGVVAWDEFPAPTREVTLGTTPFLVKDSNLNPTGPGPCVFSGDDTNVVQDGPGSVRLRITNRDGTWQCAEIHARAALGYGSYRVRTTARLDLLPRPIVFADFLFRSLTAEADIECSQTLTGVAGRCQAVVQPFSRPGNLTYFDMPPVAETTHELVWLPDSVTFRIWRGHDDTPGAGDLIAEWRYSGPDVPSAAGTLLYRLNLWLVDGAAPADGLEHEVVLSDFSFRPPGATSSTATRTARPRR